MLVGIASFGMITAALASWLVQHTNTAREAEDRSR
jgi:hypothetical protein